MEYFKKFKSQFKSPPPRPDWSEVGFIWFGGFIAILAIGFLADYTKQPLVLGSFGASCFIVFTAPDSHFSQPRNVIGGHFISTLVGLVFLHFVGPEWWSMALALATAITVMLVLRVSHPPAGSNPLIVFLVLANWDFLIMPTLLGAVILVTIALFYNNISKKRHYPTYWF